MNNPGSRSLCNASRRIVLDTLWILIDPNHTVVAHSIYKVDILNFVFLSMYQIYPFKQYKGRYSPGFKVDQPH